MTQASRFLVDLAWRIILKDLGVNEDEMLRRAQLPLDLFSRKNAELKAGRLFQALGRARNVFEKSLLSFAHRAHDIDRSLQSTPDTDFKDPGEVLNALTIVSSSEENNDMFFTIWYGVYNITREMNYASGGHPPALLLSGTPEEGFQSAELKTHNFVIGGRPEVAYQKATRGVEKGSTLTIFSDGVYEVQKLDGSMWSFKEFLKFIVQPEPMDRSRLDCLRTYVTILGNSKKSEDDFTILEITFWQTRGQASSQ